MATDLSCRSKQSTPMAMVLSSYLSIASNPEQQQQAYPDTAHLEILADTSIRLNILVRLLLLYFIILIFRNMNMNSHIQTLDLVKSLNKLDEKNLALMLSNLSPKAITKLCELIHNLEYDSHRVPKKLRNKIISTMNTHKKTCKHLTNPNINIHRKRSVIQKQSGNGLFSIILAAGIPLLLSLITGKKK